MASANAAEVDDRFLPAVGSLLLPTFNPLHDFTHHVVHPADGVHLLATFAESRVDVDPGTRDSYPERAEMFEHKLHIGGLAENAHVGQHAVVYEIVRSRSIAAVLLALEFGPLRFFDLTGDGGDEDVALQLDSGALKRL